MSNIFANMFSGVKQQQQQPQPQQPGPGNQPSQQQKPPEEDGFKQSTATDPKQVEGKTEESDTFSLADLEKLFDTEVDEQGNPKVPQDDDDSDFFTYDQKGLREGVGKMNFTSGEEFNNLAAEALKGDGDSFIKVLNLVAQNAVAQSAEISAGISNRATRNSYDRAMKKLPDSVRSLAASDNLSGINPKYTSKGLSPMTNMVKKQVEQKYPDAGAAEIAKLVNNYMSTAVQELSGNSTDPTRRPDPQSNQESQPGDFSSFFSQ